MIELKRKGDVCMGNSNKNQYTSLACLYDDLNSHVDYISYANYIDRTIKKNELSKSSLVLDLACGTGKMTFLLRSLGYDMTGIDSSEDMLSQARMISEKKGIKDILWLCQEMQNFELYGTVDVCVCCLDSLNYLTSRTDLEKCFNLVHNYLIPNGLFIFDMNTKFKFENIYGNNDYVIETENSLCAWQNRYNHKNRICDFYLSFFKKDKDGKYDRYDEFQQEKCYTEKQIRNLLLKCGFELISEESDFNGNPIEKNSERMYITARNIKE